ncbi:growth/differentiation factor 15 [Cyrtonyx montezumae]|uniref:growth/differentiation factor 15 n=1 Tax=Cyrtonyx montezumae TaxID=9017 RepID=UPI0032DB4AD7
MLRDVGAVTVTCLQLLLLAGGAQPRPRAWDEDGQQLEAIKHGILRRLGMAGPPPVPHAPDPESINRARRVYERRVAELRANRSREREEREGAAAATHRHRLTAILQRLPDPPRAEWDPHGSGTNQRTPGPPPGRTVTSWWCPARALSASGRRCCGRSCGPRSAQLRIGVYPPGGSGGAPQALLGRGADPCSHQLDVTEPVRRWAAGHGAVLRLEMTFSSHASAPWDGTGTGSALLEVETRDAAGRGARRRRGLDEECGKSDGKCCRRVLKVSFQEIGWDDWVLAPRSYDMRFCQGSCPHNYRAASIHAQIQARVHALSRAAPAPCCVPAAYDPMVLMHYDAEGRLVSSVFEDMLVTRCHCA